MIKPLVILFNTVSVFLFSFFFGDTPVTVTGNFPKTAKPNTEFAVEIKINKGGVSGFAKLQIEVPQGVTVKEVESKGGNFSFASGIGKIIWTATPSDAEFTVKFLMVGDATVSGSKTIASKFSYVNNNAKEVVEMTPAEILFGDGAAVVATTPTETQSTAPANNTSSSTPPASTTNNTPSFDNPVEPNSNVMCKRTISNGANANEINVEVKIRKPAIKGFAKYQEILPTGYNAKGIKTNGSSFSVSDGKAKFVWVSLPPEDEMIISYVLEKGTGAADAKLEGGEFSYLESDQTKKIKMPVESIGGNTTTEPVANNAAATQTTEPVATNTTAVTTTEPVVNNTTEPVKNTTTEPVKNTTEPASTNIAKKEGNVLYSVQVGAFRNAIQSDVLSKKFNISEPIKSEMAEGYSKFIVGNFGEYKQARNHREDIKQKGCNSAFVVAYNGAKRITVQEALMITSQKWYK